MSNAYAVRIDGKGWRSVSSQNDVDTEFETFSATQPVPIVVPVVLSCDSWQFHEALRQKGWLQSVIIAVNAANDPALLLAFERAPTFHQNNPKVLQMAAVINKTADDVQSLFELAVTLNPKDLV